MLKRWDLIGQLIQREVLSRYRGSVFGVAWSMLTPLFMLGIYTFVFGTVFKTRWAGSGDDTSMGQFAVMVFSGLIVFQIFAEVINRAPGLILANQNYVKKVVFPIEILPVVALGSALFHAAVSFGVLLIFRLIAFGDIPPAVLAVPLILIPYSVLILGLSWFLASIGTYFRDIGQTLGAVVTGLMFLSPIFFPMSAMPEWIRPWLVLNPIALPVEQVRELVAHGTLPALGAFVSYTLVAVVLATLGFVWFQKTRKGFADVL